MITFTQARERAEAWVNGDVPAYERREVRVREFDLGYVVWAEDREDGPTSDGARSRLVIAREDGRTTLWPALPVDEVIRSYELAYGAPRHPEPEAAVEPPKRQDLEATSFLLSPPQWLQDAADKLGIPDNRRASGKAAEGNSDAAEASSAPKASPDQGSTATGSTPTPPPAAPAAATPWADANADSDASVASASVAPPATVLAPPVSGSDVPDASPGARAEAKTELLPSGSALPPTRVAPAVDAPVSGGPAAPEPPSVPSTPPPGRNAPGLGHLPPPTGPSVHATPPPGWLSAVDIADAETSKAMPPRAHTPPLVAPKAPDASTPPPAAPGGYVATQLVPSLDADGPTPPPTPGAPGTPAGPPTPPGVPGTPPGPRTPPGTPGTPPPAAHAAATVLASPSDLPGGPAGRGTPPPPPPPPPATGAPG
ncbi:hypothetical protein ACFOSC_24430, partial [Streptantibioticus rubrisoli]